MIVKQFFNAVMFRLVALESEMTMNALNAVAAGDAEAERRANDMASGVAAAMAEVLEESDDKRWSTDHNNG
jgi:hypothetical protein